MKKILISNSIIFYLLSFTSIFAPQMIGTAPPIYSDGEVFLTKNSWNVFLGILILNVILGVAYVIKKDSSRKDLFKSLFFYLINDFSHFDCLCFS
jgi:hypothetical protein